MNAPALITHAGIPAAMTAAQADIKTLAEALDISKQGCQKKATKEVWPFDEVPFAGGKNACIHSPRCQNRYAKRCWRSACIRRWR